MLLRVATLLVVARLADGQLQVRRQDDGITVEGLAEAGGRRQYSCPARFVRMGNSCYFMSSFMATWHDAHFKCRGMRAHLAAFEKRSENHNMRKYLMREELAPLSRWIGGIYQWKGRFWMWGSSGLPVAYKAWPRRFVTNEWERHCMFMDPVSNFQWRPANCFDTKHYICETPLKRNKTRAKVAGTNQHRGHHRQKPGFAVESSDKEGARRTTPALLPANGTAVPSGVATPIPTVPPWSVQDRRPAAPSRTWEQRQRVAPRRHQGMPHRGYRPPQPPAQPAARHPHSEYPGSVLGTGAAAWKTRAYRVRHLGSPRGGSSPRRPQQVYAAGATGGTSWIGKVEASVRSLYPPGRTRDDNDFSNNV